MAQKLGEIYVDLKARTAEYEAKLRHVQTKTEIAASRMTGAFASITRAAAGFGIAFGAAAGVQAIFGMVRAASDLNESANKAKEVFGDAFGAIERFADNAANSIGAARRESLAMTGEIGNLLVSFGLTEKAAADLSIKTVQLAADLGSFNNTSTEEALLAIRSALVGQSEPMLRFGADTRQTRLEQVALAEGIIESKRAMNAQERALAALAAITADTKKAQGDFARTSDSAANASKIFAANMRTLGENIGNIFLPSITSAVVEINRLFEEFSKPRPEFVSTLKAVIASEEYLLGVMQERKDLTSEEYFSLQARSDIIAKQKAQILDLAKLWEQEKNAVAETKAIITDVVPRVQVLGAATTTQMENWNISKQILTGTVPLVEGTAEAAEKASHAAMVWEDGMWRIKEDAEEITKQVKLSDAAMIGLTASAARFIKQLSQGKFELSSLLTALSFIPGAPAGFGAAAAVSRVFGFAEGGSFRVGGSGGTDSQLVAFRATPGERVSVQTPQQVTNNHGGVTIIAPELHSIDDDFIFRTRIMPKIRKELGR